MQKNSPSKRWWICCLSGNREFSRWVGPNYVKSKILYGEFTFYQVGKRFVVLNQFGRHCEYTNKLP